MATKTKKRTVEIRKGAVWKRYKQSSWGEWFLVAWNVILNGKPGRWHRIDCTCKRARRMFASYELSKPKDWEPPISTES